MRELEMEKTKQIFFDEMEIAGCLESIRDQLAEKLEDAPNDNSIVVLGKDINDFTTFINIVRGFCEEYMQELDYPMPTQKEYKKAIKKFSKGKSRVKKIIKQNDYDAINVFNALVKFHNENMKFILGDLGDSCESVTADGTLKI